MNGNIPESKEAKPTKIPDGDEEEEQQERAIAETGEDTKKKNFGSNKPEFKRPIECEIIEASFQTDSKIVKEDKGKALPEDKQYQKHWLMCKFKYVDKETKEEKTFEQSYGSIREYKNRLWIGTANNLAELKGILEAFVSVPIENIWDMPKELIGKKCSVKSAPWEVGNSKGFTNKIQDFVEEE